MDEKSVNTWYDWLMPVFSIVVVAFLLSACTRYDGGGLISNKSVPKDPNAIVHINGKPVKVKDL